jgi:PAS domain S-box-containing protein
MDKPTQVSDSLEPADESCDRKRSDEPLKESENRYRRLVENSPAIVWSFSDKRGTLFVSSRVNALLGYSPDFLYADPWLWNRSIHPADRQAVCRSIEDFAAGQDLDVEYRIKDSSGNWRWFHDQSIDRQVSDGEVIIEGISIDITDRKKAEEQVRQREEELTAILDNIPVMINYFDSKRNLVYANKTMERITGWTLEEMKQRDLMPEFYPEKEYRQTVLEFINRGEGVWGEFKIRMRDGRVLDMMWANVLLSDGTNIGIGQDVTERKRIEEALRESEQRFSIIFHASPISIAIARLNDNTLTDVNPAWEKVTGFSRDEAVGRTSTELGLWVNPDDRNRLLDNLRQGGAVRDLELQLRHKAGPVSSMLMSAGFIELSGEPCLFTLATDITSLKQFEKQLLASQRMNTIAQVAAGVAHEVRNPLNAILAVTEALSLTLQEDQERKPYLDHIRSQVDRLAGLMQDLLELGKPVKPAPLEGKRLLEICKAAVEEWEHYGSCKANQVHLICPSGISEITVPADAIRLEQAFVNLLENASQHSPEGSEIDFAIFETSDFHLGVRIVDRGTGIPMENLPRVFDPFFTTRRKGTGLGLSIVRQIIESHGGSVRLYCNDPPPGCTVEISLPIAPED